MERMSESVRFERYETVGIIGLDNVCLCWKPSPVGGPFVRHPAACICQCHSPTPQFGG